MAISVRWPRVPAPQGKVLKIIADTRVELEQAIETFNSDPSFNEFWFVNFGIGAELDLRDFATLRTEGLCGLQLASDILVNPSALTPLTPQVARIGLTGKKAPSKDCLRLDDCRVLSDLIASSSMLNKETSWPRSLRGLAVDGTLRRLALGDLPTDLQALRLSNARSLRSLGAISGPRALSYLELESPRQIRDWPALPALHEDIEILKLSAALVEDITWVSELHAVRVVDLRDCGRLLGCSALLSVHTLEELWIGGNTVLSDLSGAQIETLRDGGVRLFGRMR